jgi:hypothetical protein
VKLVNEESLLATGNCPGLKKYAVRSTVGPQIALELDLRRGKDGVRAMNGKVVQIPGRCSQFKLQGLKPVQFADTQEKREFPLG